MATKASTSFWDTNLGKTLKAAAYVAVSAVVAFLVTATTDNPELLGPATVLVNVLLVYVQKTFFDPSTRNV